MSQQRTPIAVVIPTLDEAAAIGRCLESLGSDPDLEVAVSDGGSRDGTQRMVAAFRPDALVIEQARGRGPQLNRGAAATSAPLLLFLHADCALPAGWAGAVRRVLADPGVAVGCFRLHTGPPPGAAAGRLRRTWWRLLDLRSFGLGLPYGDQAIFLRRGLFDQLGGFPEIPLMEDVALVRGCLRHGRLARVPLSVRTTARRFAVHPWRSRVATATFPLLFRLGVSPHRLARWYGAGR